jgi:serine/threonine protein kinase
MRPAKEQTMKVSLTVTAGPHEGQAFEFREHDTFIVGRSKNAHFRLPHKDKTFSRFHFMVEMNPPQCRLMDMASTNGTKLNGEKVTTTDLKDGDTIRAGQTVFAVSIEPEKPDLEPPPHEHHDHSYPTRHEPESAPTADFPDHDALPKIPGYRIERELGKGGMGAVYLAQDESNGEMIALKTIIPAVAGSPGIVARFLREASILRQLDHPNIIRFRSIGQAEGRLYFAMDYAPGLDAAQLVKKSGPLSIPQAVRIACQALDGLAYAHAKGFVHRDIKPHNILLTKVDGQVRVKIADFGLARLYQNSPMSGLTVMGEVGGSTHYMPPEQILDFRQAKPAADQYSLAATLYFLLTGKKIYDYPEGSRRALLMILHDEPIPIRSRRPDIPEALADAIHRALERDHVRRFSDTSEQRRSMEMHGNFEWLMMDSGVVVRNRPRIVTIGLCGRASGPPNPNRLPVPEASPDGQHSGSFRRRQVL